MSLGLASPAAAAPQRIVSLGICGDRIALALVAPERIAALSREAGDPRLSPEWEKARTRPVHDGSAESVLAHQPDVVLASAWARGNTMAMLERLRVRVVRLGMPRSFEEIRSEIRAAAAALEVPERGEAWIAEMDRSLASVRHVQDPRPLAAYLMPDGLTAGRDTPVHAAMVTAGMDNLTARLGYTGWGLLGLEHIAAAQPDVLVLSHFDDDPRLALRIAAHPVLRRLPHTRAIEVPGRIWLCADPYVAEAAALLAEAARR